MAHIDQDNTNSPAMGAGYTFDIDDAQDFLEHVFPNFTTFAFQSLPPKGTAHDDPARQQLTRLKVGTVDDAEDFLDDLTAAGANTYYCLNQISPNATDRKAASFIGTMGTVALDLDNSPIGPVINCFLPSHAIIYTSEGRAQLLWRIEGLTDQDVASDLIQRLARLFNGDAVIHDMARVLRLPGGFNHNHGEPCRVTWEPGGADAPYTMDAFIAAIEEIEQIKRLEPWVRSTRKAVERDGHVLGAGEAFVTSELLCEALSLLRNDGWADDDKQWERVAMAFARLSGGDPVVEDALRDWSHGSENDRSSIICSDARRGKLTYKPGAAGHDLEGWLREHHVDGEEERAEELGVLIRLNVDEEQVRKSFDLVPVDQAPTSGGGDGGGDNGLPTLRDIPGGSYPRQFIMREFSRRFTFVNRAGSVLVARRAKDGSLTFFAQRDFERFTMNIFARIPQDDGDEKLVPAAKFWMHNPDRGDVKELVFKPHGYDPLKELNLWTGFGYEPGTGTDKIKKLLRHIHKIICKRNKKKFRYIMKWMAWVVQHPELPAEAIPVFRSESEGSGKSTVSDVLRKLFGRHSTELVSADQLLGSHSGEANEHICFVALEEVFFAGDRRTNDALKARITGETTYINPKGSKAYSAPNRLSATLTTNHDWAVPAGKDARRWVVYDVSEEMVGKFAYFNAIRADLDAGGYGQLLGFLQRVKLGNWHPRQIIRTEELAREQERSAGSIEQWLFYAAQEGAAPRFDKGTLMSFSALELGEEHGNPDLYNSYAGYTKMTSGRVEHIKTFGRRMTKILGEKHRRQNMQGARAGDKPGRGYLLPDETTLRELLIKALGIRTDVE